MAVTIATMNLLLNLIILLFAAIITVQVARSASRFKTGDAGMLFRKLRTGFIVFSLFASVLGLGSLLSYIEVSPAFMVTGQNFEIMILASHVLLVISLIILLVFANNFAEFSEKFSFGK